MRILFVAPLLVLTACPEDPSSPSPPTAVQALELGPGAREFRAGFDERSALRGWKVESGDWALSQGAEGPRLSQRSTENEFCWILCPEPAEGASDVDVSVRFKPLSGKVDASGGIAIRARGEDYLVLRANCLEQNLRVYAHRDGRREVAAGTRIAPPALGTWHTLRIVAIGPRVQAWLNGELLLDFETDFVGPGRVGLWTKADAVTEFDDLVVRWVEG